VLITNLHRVPAGTEGAISLEGTLASVVGSALMSVLVLALGLIASPTDAALVASVGVVATLLESVLGALVQGRVAWLSNEMVNGIQTALAALLAMGLSLLGAAAT
jgi:Predicted membrane protein